MKDFFNMLEIKILAAIKNEFSQIINKIKKERIYAVALVADIDYVALHLSVNTWEFLKKADDEYGFTNGENRNEIIKLLKGKLSDAEIERFKRLPFDTTKWLPDDWGYSDFDKNSEFVNISKLLRSKNRELNLNSMQGYLEWQNMFVETTISAFRKAIQGDYFGLNPEETTYFICIMDADEKGEEIMEISAKSLNTENIYREFQNNFDCADQELMSLVDNALASL